MTDLTHTVTATGAYDFTPNKPGQSNYGIHGVDLTFTVSGPRGTVALTIFTNWYIDPDILVRPYFANFSWHHAKEPDDSTLYYHIKDCHHTGGDCWSTSSGLYAREFQPGFIHGGTDWLWPKLEQEYYHTFYPEGHKNHQPRPDLTPVPRPHPDTARPHPDTEGHAT